MQPTISTILILIVSISSLKSQPLETSMHETRSNLSPSGKVLGEGKLPVSEGNSNQPVALQSSKGEEKKTVHASTTRKPQPSDRIILPTDGPFEHKPGPKDPIILPRYTERGYSAPTDVVFHLP